MKAIWSILLIFSQYKIRTNMHSSRMRAARALTVFPASLPRGGGKGVCLNMYLGVSLPKYLKGVCLNMHPREGRPTLQKADPTPTKGQTPSLWTQ